jgi:hypothetical protein
MASLSLKLRLAALALAGKKKGLADLFRLTAAAFGQEPPQLRGLSRRDMLDGYARFTRSQVEKALASGAAAGIRKNLYDRSLRLGREIRGKLPVRSRADAAAALHGMYRILAIDKRVDARGAVTVTRCFFAAHYTPEVCRFMSAMDEGIVAGLCGGRLAFSRRLTEGADGCRALIAWPGGENE